MSTDKIPIYGHRTLKNYVKIFEFLGFNVDIPHFTKRNYEVYITGNNNKKLILEKRALYGAIFGKKSS